MSFTKLLRERNCVLSVGSRVLVHDVMVDPIHWQLTHSAIEQHMSRSEDLCRSCDYCSRAIDL